MFRQIVVPLDESALAEQAIGTAVAIARVTGGEIRLVLAHPAARHAGLYDPAWQDVERPEESVYLRSLASRIEEATGVRTSGTVEWGAPVPAICARAQAIDADLIVITSHGRTGLSRAVLGSVADGVVREGSVPVLMLRSTAAADWKVGDTPLFQRILVALDGSAMSASILDAAIGLAVAMNAQLILARVIMPIPLYVFDAGLPAYPSPLVDALDTQQIADIARQELTALARRLKHDHGITVETEVAYGEVSAATTILAVANCRNADLIAMTTHGRDLTRLVIGSVADKVLRGGHLPLLLYHPSAAAQMTLEASDDVASVSPMHPVAAGAT